MTNINISRRGFIKGGVTAAAALPLLINCRGAVLADEHVDGILAKLRRNAQSRGTAAMGAIDFPDNVGWRSIIPINIDDGEPMIISGTVFGKDGKTPAANTLIYYYHTDKFGIYGRSGQHTHGRFRGWMLTDAKGRYEFSSIRPASYPNSRQSQHVHMTITTVNSREDWIDSILFEGDNFISARERETAGHRGGFHPIVMLEKGASGIARAVRDIRL